jgi:hypothetical protein
MKKYKKGDRIPVRAQQIWHILTSHAVLKPDGQYESDGGWSGWGKGLITYSDLAEQMGMSRNAGRTLSRHLGLIGFFCIENNLPPLNTIVINDDTGIPGKGVVEKKGFSKDQKNVLDHPWFSYRPPTIGVLKNLYDEHIAIAR